MTCSTTHPLRHGKFRVNARDVPNNWIGTQEGRNSWELFRRASKDAPADSWELIFAIRVNE